MPTTTWVTIRRDIAREMGFFLGTMSTATGGIAGDTEGVSILSRDFAPHFPRNDYFVDWYALLLGQTQRNGNVVRRVVDYQVTMADVAGIIVSPTSGANLTGETVGGTSTVNIEMHVFNPERIRDWFNRARQDLYPHMGIARDHQAIITGQHQRSYTLPSTLRGGPISVWLGERTPVVDLAENVLLNPGFEDWTNSTTPTSWTKTGTNSTVTQEKETTSPKNYAVLEGANSARLVNAASETLTLLQAVDLSASTKIATEGMEVNLSLWVYCKTASRVRARISGTDVASSPVRSSYHGGSGWEKLTVSANLTSAATGFDAGVEVDSAGTAIALFLDEALCVVGQSEIRHDRWEPLDVWTWLPPIDGGANGGLLEFPEPLIEKRAIRIFGRDILSSVTADSDTVEASGQELDVLYNKTREYLCLEQINMTPEEGQQAFWRDKAGTYRAKVQYALNGMGAIPMTRRRWKIPDA